MVIKTLFSGRYKDDNSIELTRQYRDLMEFWKSDAYGGKLRKNRENRRLIKYAQNLV